MDRGVDEFSSSLFIRRLMKFGCEGDFLLSHSRSLLRKELIDPKV